MFNHCAGIKFLGSNNNLFIYFLRLNVSTLFLVFLVLWQAQFHWVSNNFNFVIHQCCQTRRIFTKFGEFQCFWGFEVKLLKKCKFWEFFLRSRKPRLYFSFYMIYLNAVFMHFENHCDYALLSDMASGPYHYYVRYLLPRLYPCL